MAVFAFAESAYNESEDESERDKLDKNSEAIPYCRAKWVGALATSALKARENWARSRRAKCRADSREPPK